MQYYIPLQISLLYVPYCTQMVLTNPLAQGLNLTVLRLSNSMAQGALAKTCNLHLEVGISYHTVHWLV